MNIYFDPDEAVAEPEGADAVEELDQSPNPEVAESDDLDDETLDRIFGKDDEDADASETSEDAEPETPEDDPEPEYDEAKYEDALSVLQRDTGLSRDELSKIDPSRLIERSDVVRKRQQDNDALGKNFHRLSGELEALKSQLAPKTEEKDEIDKIGELLKEEYGDKMGEIAPLLKQLRDRAERAEQSVQALSGYLERTNAEQARQRLGEEFPGLQDPDQYAKVEETMRGLVAGLGDKYQGNMDLLMRDAALLSFGEQRKADVVGELERKARTQRKSQPQKTHAAPPSDRKLSKDEIDEKILEMIDSGKYTREQMVAWRKEHE